MALEVIVPHLGDEGNEGTVGFWRKSEGEDVEEGEDLVEIDTDDGSFLVASPASGVLTQILAEEGAEVKVGNVIAMIEEE